MPDIQFDEESSDAPSPEPEKPSAFVRLVLATGLVSSEKSAESVLLVLAIAAILISGFVIYGAAKPHGLTNADIERITKLQQGI